MRTLSLIVELSGIVELVNETLWSGTTRRQARGRITHPFKTVKPPLGIATFGGELGCRVKLVS